MLLWLRRDLPVCLRKGDAGEEVVFQGTAALEVILDTLMALWNIVAVALQDIGQAFVQRDNMVVTNPFVGIIDDLFGMKDPAGVPLC